MRRIEFWLAYISVSAVFGIGWLVLLSLPISLCWQVLGGMWNQPINYRAVIIVTADLVAASIATALLFVRPIRKASTLGESFGISFLFAAALAVIWGELFGLATDLFHGWTALGDILTIGMLAVVSLFYAYASFYIVLPFATLQVWTLHALCRWRSPTKKCTTE